MNRRYTPENNLLLDCDDILVVRGEKAGLEGQKYYIPVDSGDVTQLKPYVDDFIALAWEWDQNTFYVTRINEGVEGLPDEEVAPLFKAAYDFYNVRLPKSYALIIKRIIELP